MSNNNDGQTKSGTPWAYSNQVKEHFFKPKNFASKSPENFSGLGMVGSPACGDVMKVWIIVDEKSEKITDFKWQTFGCASAIATSSISTEMILEKNVNEALELTNKAVAEALDGLPPAKMHCSVLAEEAIKAAIEDYISKK